ncbi:MAG TPA: zinc ribbon domain-containing protein [Blastocatellia bacterium]|nr:zinc ribbon domain-containing protein [Blastocatellia bacterium]
MFCPQCGANNDRDQKFCRQCGQALTAVRLAIDGRVDEALEKLRKGEDSLASGAINLAVFSSIACVMSLVSLFVTAFEAEPWATINIIIGLAIGLPLAIRGIVRLERARKILEAEDQKKRADQLPDRAKVSLPASPITAPTSLPQASAASVTEHTTYELEPPDRTTS